MAWGHLSITKPHLVYIILGGFTSLFMLCSSVIKERMYIGEATVATICGVIFGPHAANLINPFEWGNTDEITLEFSRIVLVIQCFAVGVELPKFYMERHWRSVVFLLVPVMAFGWLMTSVFVYALLPKLNWLDALVVAACVTATDPVLASSVVGKGKFARRVPKHLRDLLSAESGCNDGMAFPFVYLALYLIQFDRGASDVSFNWIVIVILYECVFGAIYGFLIGYVARIGIKWAHELDLIDRESFLSFYFVLGLFCAGSGSILGLDDLLVGFAAGVGFSNDGWFGEKTDESHVSNVIDLLLNLSYFVYLGTIIPWELYSSEILGLTPWRLAAIAILVIFFRRIPIMLICKPVIPDLKTWREAMFAGHFGPIGVGAVFVAILAKAELSTNTTIPSPAEDIPDDHAQKILIDAVFPIVSFLVVSSILVHGSSVAVFTLGKRINTLTITMSYTKDTGDDGPEWLRKLPKISSQSRSMAKSASSGDDEGKVPPGMLPSTENEGFLFEKAEDAKKGSLASSVGWRKKKKREDGVGPGGPISQSAIYPEREKDSEIAISSTTSPSPQDSDPPSPTTPHPAYFRGRDPEKAVPEPQAPKRKASPTRSVRSQIEVYEEGSQWIIEDKDGEVLAVTPARNSHDIEQGIPEPQQVESRPDSGPTQDSFWTFSGLKSRFNSFITEEKEKRKENSERTRKQSTAYQYGHTVIVEDEDGEVVKRYDISSQDRDTSGHDFVSQSMRYMRVGGFTKGHVDSRLPLSASNEPPATGLGPHRQRKQTLANLQQEEDDKNVRFRIEGEEGGRMDKEELIRAITQRTARHEHSTTSEHVKEMSKKASEKLVPKLDSRRQYSRPPIPAEAGASGGGGGGGGRDLEQSDTAKAGTRSGSEYPTGPTNPHSSPTVAVTAAADEAIIVPGPSSPIATATLLSPLDHRGVSPRPLSRDSHRSHRSQGSQRQSMTMEGEPMETDAEKRRREAALGMNDDHENDSEDDNTERALPAAQKRGIRWVDSPPKD